MPRPVHTAAVLAAALLVAGCIELPPPLPSADGGSGGGSTHDVGAALDADASGAPADSVQADGGTAAPWVHPCGADYGAPAATRVEAGGSMACLLAGGQATCWGYGDGLPYVDPSHAGDPVGLGVSDVESLALGAAHGCARRDNGDILCFGRGGHGQLGRSVTPAGGTASFDDVDPIPTEYDLLDTTGLASVHAGPATFSTCVMDTGGLVGCWGFLLDGTIPTEQNTWHQSLLPAVVEGLVLDPDRGAVSAGTAAACAWETGGRAWCWGYGQAGALGNGAAFDTPVHQGVVLDGDRTVDELAVGVGHVCAFGSCGTDVFCWGENGDGQLGRSNAVLAYDEPQTVAGLPADVLAVGAGLFHSCVLTVVGDVYCWGSNQKGQLALQETVVGSASPVRVEGLDTAVGLAVGYEFACALEDGGAVKCWGDNEFGQLGVRPVDLDLSRVPLVVGRVGEGGG